VVENIKLRFIPETHELACHPLYLTVLVKSCTKPREGSLRENVIRQVYKELHDTMQAAVSERAARALVQLAVELELLDKKDLHWTAKGHVINEVSADPGTINNRFKQLNLKLGETGKPFRHVSLRLLPKEQIAYLKYFLDADGAFLIHFLRELGPSFSFDNKRQREFLENGGIEKIFEKVADEYLSHVFDIEPRHELNQLLKRVRKGYDKHVRLHKFIPRMEILVDLGILDKVVNENVCYQSALTKNHSSTEIFLDQFNDPKKLDDILSVDGDFFERAAKIYHLQYAKADLNRDYQLLQKEIVKSYESVRDETFRLAHLDAIMDLVCITSLTSSRKLCEWKDVKKIVEKMHKESEKDIRFHVNDWGVISYVAISESYIKEVA